MKVMLLNPTERRIVQANLPLEIESVRGRNQPVGLLYVAAAARSVPGVTVEVLDAHALGLDAKGIERAVAASKPDVIGLTSVTFNLPDVIDCVAAVKRAHPSAYVALGGMQPYLYPEETLALPGVDGLFLGEAETSFPAFLRHFRDADKLRGVPGLMVRVGGEVVHTGVAPMADDLDALPLPAQDLLNPELYDSVITDAHPVTTMVTSRGCPFQCRFCSQSITGKSYRFHSPERVLEEIKGCMDLGYRGILFYDEVFTIRRKRVIELCTLIQKERMRFDWMARGTINTVDGDLMRAMHDAGCRTITFGVESGSERILKRMNRPVRDTKKIAKVFRDAKAAGLTSLAYMMLGNPDETVEDMKATRAMLRAINPDHVHISVFVAYPATEFYREGVERGLFSSDVWRGFAANPAEAFRVPTWPEAPPAETLFAEARRLYRTHYFRPHNIWRHLRAAGGLRGIRKRLPYLQALLRLRRAPAAG